MSSFENFCVAICSLIGVDPPPLREQAEGERAFVVTVGEARVEFMEGTLDDVPGVVMSTTFGAPPPDKEAEVMCALLNANFELAGVGSPAFARNPDTGEFGVNHTLLLLHINVQKVYDCLLNASEAVADWKETFFLSPPRHKSPTAAWAAADQFA